MTGIGLEPGQDTAQPIGSPELDMEVEAPAIEVDVTAEPASEIDSNHDRRVQLARRLAETRVIVDRVLETVSEARLEARRLVTKELGIDPRPEILNTIVKIACDRSEGGLCRELPRHLLTVHSLIELELARLLDIPEIDGGSIRASRKTLPELRHLARQIQAEITSALETQPHGSQDYLMQVCNSLDVPEERVATAMLLAPRLELFVRAGASGDLRTMVPALNDDEIALLARLFELGSSENSPGRNCLNSIALRSMMAEDIERWVRICLSVSGPEESLVIEPDYVARMGLEKTAFHFISDRLQGTQDSALVAGLQGFADEVRGFRQSLFATYLEFTPALRGATLGKAGSKTSADESALLKLIEDTLEADAAADAARANETSKEELYMRALTDMREEPTEAVDEFISAGTSEVQSPRRWLRLLVGVAALLFVICAAVYAPILLAPAPAAQATLADFAPAVALTEMVTVGGTMYARVSKWSWEDLSTSEQLARVEEVGGIARSKNVNGVMLADEAGRELAHWNRTEGATLLPLEP